MRLGLGLGVGRRNRGGTTPDTLSPTLLTATLAADGLSVALLASEPLFIVGDPTSYFLYSQFQHVNNEAYDVPGDWLFSATSSAISGATVTIGNQIVFSRNEAWKIRYTKGGDPDYWLKDAAGNYLDDFAFTLIDTSGGPIDNTAPSVAGNAYIYEDSFEFYSNELLKIGGPYTTSDLVFSGTSATVATIAVAIGSGDESIISGTLTGTVYEDETVTATWTRTGAAIEDLAGNDLANFTNMAVDNQSTETALAPTSISAAGTQLRVSCGVDLVPGVLSNPGAFTLENTAAVILSGEVLQGYVALETDTPVTEFGSATISYDPSGDVIRGAAGGVLAAFADEEIIED